MSGPGVFALLVGIDNYKADLIPNLRGCVADAYSVRDYFVEHLQVPLDNIHLLTDGDATRDSILQAFKDHFIINNRVRRGDTIVFYFAGHGSRVASPTGWNTDDEHVETICPHDEAAGAEGLSPIFGIPTRTLGALWHELVGIKCPDNMATILDCCHSGSGIRGRIARRHENRIMHPATLDNDIWGRLAIPQQASIPSRFIHLNIPSHVILVPCRQNQSAYELDINDSRRGAFTHGIISTLQRLPTSQITYAQLINRLPSLPDQDPQSEGDNKFCLIFTSIPQHRARFFNVRKYASNDLEVAVGNNEGVVKGTEFIVFSEANASSPTIGVFSATFVTPTTCHAVPKYRQSIDDISKASYAIVTRWKSPDAELAVFIASGAGSTSLSEILAPTRLADYVAPFNVIRASSSSDADIVLHLADGSLHVTRTDRFIGVHANPHIQAKVGGTANSVLHLLHSAAHFKFHLARARTPIFWSSPVKVELCQLKESDDGKYVPTGYNFIQGGHAYITLNDDPYGLTLKNKSNRDLFPSLFYFDPSDYSIEPWYTSPNMVSPLRSKSNLKVGHGNQDGRVINFTLRQGEVSDTGFLVLYLSYQYRDMSYLQQDSAFDAVHQADTFERTAHWKMVNLNDLFWSPEVTIITVMRKTGLEAAKQPPPTRQRIILHYSLVILVLFLLLSLLLAYGLVSY